MKGQSRDHAGIKRRMSASAAAYDLSPPLITLLYFNLSRQNVLNKRSIRHK
jgi:hypothetical protein